MKNLLFILSIITFSFNLQAQPTNSTVNLNETNEKIPSTEEEFFNAVRSGDIESVIYFLDIGFMDGKGVDVNASDKLGRTALHIAAANVNIDMVEVLWERGASVMASDLEGNTPLHALALGASLRAFNIDDNDGERPSSLSVAEFLLDKGADSIARNAFGLTPVSTVRGIAGFVTYFVNSDDFVSVYESEEYPDESLLEHLSWIDDLGPEGLSYRYRMVLRDSYLYYLNINSKILSFLIQFYEQFYG